jgi:methylated-DNA-[protein]-cysteine S-methyltransferase
MQIFQKILESPIGPLTLRCSEKAVVALDFGAPPPQSAPKSHYPPLVAQAENALKAYFLQDAKALEQIPLQPKGTPFQQEVWELLKKIPYGQTRTYGEIALQLHNPKASRAVGSANSKNPIPLFIPCHRVLGAKGKLTGFAGGLERKEKLLKLENILLF